MNGHKDLPDLCQKLGLPSPSAEGTKSERVAASFDTSTDANLPSVAERLLQVQCPAAEKRNEIQDLLWARHACPDIPKKFRRELARALSAPLYADSGGFQKLLDWLWVLDTDPLGMFFGDNTNRSLRAQIDQHVYRNPDDWTPEFLFGELGAYEASGRRFALFIEGLASADVLLDEPAQRAFVGTANNILHRCGVELRETASVGGYPVFQVVSLTQGPARKPKNLIFASESKPDIRLSSAIDNDVEVVTNADSVLIYDRPIDENGLTWTHLQAWWSETQNIADVGEAKKSLYLRLKGCLPKNSPPQRLFFETYHRCFARDVPNLPALLPEVWFHWDPKTVKERGADALLRFRMDFLMLLPHGVRVVLEIDGKHHFADAEGRADGSAYTKMVSADRELKLSCYEVFRFGASELRDEHLAYHVVSEFFQPLFDRFRVKYSSVAPYSPAKIVA